MRCLTKKEILGKMLSGGCVKFHEWDLGKFVCLDYRYRLVNECGEVVNICELPEGTWHLCRSSNQNVVKLSDRIARAESFRSPRR